MALTGWPVPTEITEMIVKSLVEDVSHNNICALVSFIQTCRIFYHVGVPELYKAAVLRHPYLLAWAAETNNMAVLRHLLDAGLHPDTVHWPWKSSERQRRCCETYGEDRVIETHRAENHEPGYIFRKFYLVSDLRIKTAAGMDHDKTNFFTWFCTDAAVAGGHPYLGFASLNGSHRRPITKGWNKTWVIDCRSKTWRLERRRAGNMIHSSALHNAAAYGHVDAMRLLLERGATIDIAAPVGCGCRHVSCLRDGPPNNFKLLQDSPKYQWDLELLRWGHRGSHLLWTPLHLAICRGQLESVKLLVSQGAHYLTEARRGMPYQTPLHQAATISPARTGIIQHLLTIPRYTTQLNKGNRHGVTPLWHAYLGGRVDNMKLLTQHGADINAGVCSHHRKSSRSNNFTMLYHACASGQVDMAKLLLSLGASADTTYLVRNTGYGHGVNPEALDPKDYPGTFPMRPLDVIIAAHGSQFSFRQGRRDANLFQTAFSAITALVTATGGLEPPQTVVPGGAPHQDPLLMAARSQNLDVLTMMLMHPSFADYKAKNDVGKIVKALDAATARLDPHDPWYTQVEEDAWLFLCQALEIFQ